MIHVPLYRRGDVLAGVALLDDEDAAIAEKRWYLAAGGYAFRNQGPAGASRRVYMHREVMGVLDDPDVEVDHRNRVRVDNRRENLRLVTRQQQHQNTSSHRGSTSRHRGVSWDGKRRNWRAYAMVAGKQHWLGRYPTEEEAAAVVSRFRAENAPFSEDAEPRRRERVA
jgi:hypothetical protein